MDGPLASRLDELVLDAEDAVAWHEARAARARKALAHLTAARNLLAEGVERQDPPARAAAPPHPPLGEANGNERDGLADPRGEPRPGTTADKVRSLLVQRGPGPVTVRSLSEELYGTPLTKSQLEGVRKAAFELVSHGLAYREGKSAFVSTEVMA